MRQWNVTELREEVEPYFAGHDSVVKVAALLILKDFWETLDKWIDDKELYQNQYQMRYYNPFPPGWDAERAFLVLEQYIEEELWPKGFDTKLSKIENGIEIKISWKV